MCPAASIAIDAARDADRRLFAARQGAQRSRRRGARAVPAPILPEPDDDDAPLYAARRKIYPQRVTGTFRRIKWVGAGRHARHLLLHCRSLRWDRGPNAPDQAVLIDLPNRRFYFFFIEIWPQEFYYLTGLLILAAMALFLMNARRRPRLVRLSVPADGVDRPVPDDRAPDRGRPPRAHAARRGAVDRRARRARRRSSISSG